MHLSAISWMARGKSKQRLRSALLNGYQRAWLSFEQRRSFLRVVVLVEHLRTYAGTASCHGFPATST
jgi:hypothetical protein